MKPSRWERLAPLTGAASIVLYFVGFGLIGEVSGSATPSADEVVELLEDSPDLRVVGAYVSLLSVALLLWFAATLRSRLRHSEGDAGGLAALAFGGAVVAAAALAVGFSSIAQGAMRASSSRGVDPEAATIYYDLYRAMLSGAVPIGMAVFIGATGTAALRTATLPRRLAWASIIVGIGCVSPLLFVFTFIALLWVLVVSIWLYVGGRKEPRPADD